ncbi:hypothetical protein LA080_004814 [Diaporthe eres]|nr:hypothetical protein LA080_004814 [Diaporthe eres]
MDSQLQRMDESLGRSTNGQISVSGADRPRWGLGGDDVLLGVGSQFDSRSGPASSTTEHGYPDFINILYPLLASPASMIPVSSAEILEWFASTLDKCGEILSTHMGMESALSILVRPDKIQLSLVSFMYCSIRQWSQ